MKIIASSIIDHAHLLDDFANTELMQSYVSWFDMRTFSFIFEQGNAFTIENLRYIFANEKSLACQIQPSRARHSLQEPCNCIDGAVVERSFDESCSYINKCLTTYEMEESYQGSSFRGFLPAPDDIAQKRLKIFWGAVEKLFALPPTRVFEHKAYGKTYFGMWTFWGFCYVYLNDTTNMGIVLAASAAD